MQLKGILKIKAAKHTVPVNIYLYAHWWSCLHALRSFVHVCRGRCPWTDLCCPSSLLPSKWRGLLVCAWHLPCSVCTFALGYVPQHLQVSHTDLLWGFILSIIQQFNAVFHKYALDRFVFPSFFSLEFQFCILKAVIPLSECICLYIH